MRFERALVIRMKREAAQGAQASRLPFLDSLESAITDELRARFVVAGIELRLAWQDEGAVRAVAESLLDQGAAYSVSGQYLVLASSRQFAGDILQTAKASAVTEKTDSPVTFYALVRVAAAKPVFDTLMSKLDGRTQQRKPVRSSDDEPEREIKFFSDNLSSLISASAIREMRLTRQTSGSLMTERISYSW